MGDSSRLGTAVVAATTNYGGQSFLILVMVEERGGELRGNSGLFWERKMETVRWFVGKWGDTRDRIFGK